jgi:hypothetical protein
MVKGKWKGNKGEHALPRLGKGTLGPDKLPFSFGCQLDTIEVHIAECTLSPRQFADMHMVWERCMRLEIAFWAMAMELH